MLPQYVDFIKWVNRFLHDGSSAYIEQSGDPSLPPANQLDLYAKDKAGTSALYYENDAGTVIDLSGGLTGSGVNTRAALWTGTNTLGSDAGLTFSGVTLTTKAITLADGGGAAVGNVRSHPTLNKIEIGPTSGTSIISLITGGTQRFAVGASGEFGVGTGPTYGTAGDYLKSGGTGAPPVWTTFPSSVMSIGGTVTSGTAGSVLFVGAGPVLAQDNAKFFWDDTNYDLIIGAASCPEAAAVGRGFHVIKSGGQANINLFSYGTSGILGAMRAHTAGGTVGAPTATQSGDGTQFGLLGWDTSGWQSAANIRFVAAEAFAAGTRGGYIALLTTATGGGSPANTERFRIGPEGQWGIGGATYGSAGNYFRSGGASAVPTWAAIAASEIGSGAALTKTNDTNVTLTLGGTPTTALLAAASITAGWTGTLSVDRGGTALATLAAHALYVGNTTSAPTALAVGGTGAYLRGAAGADPIWSTLILPNSATANYIPYATSANTWGESAVLTFDGNALILNGVDTQLLIGGTSDPGWAKPAVYLQGTNVRRYIATKGDGFPICITANVYNDGSEKYIATAGAIEMQFDTDNWRVTYAASGTAGTAITWTDSFAITGRNVGIGSATWGSGAVGVLTLLNGTAPGALANTASIVAIAGKLWAYDSAGNGTQLTP